MSKSEDNNNHNLSKNNTSLRKKIEHSLDKNSKKDLHTLVTLKKSEVSVKYDEVEPLLHKAIRSNMPEIIEGIGNDGLKLVTSDYLEELLQYSYDAQKNLSIKAKRNLSEKAKNNPIIEAKNILPAKTKNNLAAEAVDKFVIANKKEGEKLIDFIKAGKAQDATFLINTGAWPNVVVNGFTALEHAVIYCQKNVVEALLNKGLNPDSSGSNLRTPLMLAVKYGYFDIAKDLADRGANIDAQDEKLNTPLMWALKQARFDIAKDLIDRGAKVNVPDKAGNTPLFYAIRTNNSALVESLLNAGADPDIENKAGFSARQLLESVEPNSENMREKKDALLKIISKKSKEYLQDKYDKKLSTGITNTLQDLANGADFQEAFKKNKLDKYLTNNPKIHNLLEEKAKYTKDQSEDNNNSVSLKEALQSIKDSLAVEIKNTKNEYVQRRLDKPLKKDQAPSH